MPAPDLRSLCTLAVTGALLGACALLEDAPPAKAIAPMAGLGTSTFAVTARDEQARAWCAHGLLLAYAFEHQEAARVFRAALARDASCAMCAWGVAHALGPNINNPERGPEREIRRYVERAQQAAAGASPLERARSRPGKRWAARCAARARPSARSTRRSSPTPPRWPTWRAGTPTIRTSPRSTPTP